LYVSLFYSGCSEALLNSSKAVGKCTGVSKLSAINDRGASGCQYELKMDEHRSGNESVKSYRGLKFKVIVFHL
jgi:hypothetical protein